MHSRPFGQQKTRLLCESVAGSKSLEGDKNVTAILSTNDVIERFRGAIADAGLAPPREIIPDGKIHRFSSNGKPRNVSGWYALHLDGKPAGLFGDWGSGLIQKWADSSHPPMTQAEREAFDERVKATREAARAEQEARHKRTSMTAQARWNRAQLASDSHTYLIRKGVRAHGLREEPPNTLIVAVCNGDLSNTNIQTLQTILPSGEKPFISGGKAKDGFFAIGDCTAPAVIVVCEGFATGASIHEATGYAVVVAFNADNLQSVCTTIRRLLPDALIVVGADDDWKIEKGNKGMNAAKQAASSVGGLVAVPRFGPDRGDKQTDFNDMAAAFGLGAVAEIFRDLIGGEKGTDTNMNDSRTTTKGTTFPPLDEAAPSNPEPLNDGAGFNLTVLPDSPTQTYKTYETYKTDEKINQENTEPPKKRGRPRLTPEQLAERKAASVNQAADIFTPKADENPVITALKKRGLYKKPLGSGKHDVSCPWSSEHIDGVDDGAVYFEPSDENHWIGGFKCRHSHAKPPRIGELLTSLGLSAKEAKNRPLIKAAAGELHRVADTAEMLLKESGRYYQRGGLVASIVTDPETGQTAIKPLTLNAMTRALSSLAAWEKFDGRIGDWVTCDPPPRVVAVVHDAEKYDHLDVLTGLARQPHLRRDGSLVTGSGFDRDTGLFGVFDPREFNVPSKPTKDQAIAAADELVALLHEFTFNTKADQSAALAAMLTAAIRPSLPLAPMFHIKAPQPASGKSYLGAIIAALATPSSVSATGFPTTDEECQKQLLALLLESPAVVMYDNLTSDLTPWKSLCSCLTEEHLTGRVLGVSKTATVGTRALFLSSGNNVDAVKDMTRRTVTITLDPRVENPAAREFKGDPLKTVKADRGRFVSQVLTIIRAWIESGRPLTDCKPLGSYGVWTELVRQPLLWLGFVDPVIRLFEVMNEDPDRAVLGRLLHGWHEVFSDGPAMVRDAVSRAQQGGELHEAMREVAEERGEINRRRLGRWIARHEGRIVDGMRFAKAQGKMFSDRWMIERIKPERINPDELNGGFDRFDRFNRFESAELVNVANLIKKPPAPANDDDEKDVI